MKTFGSGFSFQIFVESGPRTNRTSCSLEWAQKNPILTASFGGTGLIIANSRYERWEIKTNIKNEFKNELHREFAALRTHVDGKFAVIDGKFAAIDGKFAAVDSKLADLQAKQEFTQGLVLSTAIRMMEATDGDKTEMREFVKDAEKPLRCIELGEDCQEVDNCDETEMGGVC